MCLCDTCVILVCASKEGQVHERANFFFVCLCNIPVCACVFVSKEGQVPARASWLMRARTD